MKISFHYDKETNKFSCKFYWNFQIRTKEVWKYFKRFFKRIISTDLSHSYYSTSKQPLIATSEKKKIRKKNVTTSTHRHYHLSVSFSLISQTYRKKCCFCLFSTPPPWLTTTSHLSIGCQQILLFEKHSTFLFAVGVQSLIDFADVIISLFVNTS